MKLKLSTGEEFELNKGETILQSLKRNEHYIVASCGGKGSCGKCLVRVLDGKFDTNPLGKLTSEQISSGHILACRTTPKSSITIEVPQVSQLIVGDKIAIGRSRELYELLTSLGGKPTSLIMREQIKLAPPSLDDHASDLERLRRALDERGLNLCFSRDFVNDLADKLRDNNWDITLCYEPAERRVLFAEPYDPYHSRYALAIDIGTTTIVEYLVDLSDGRIVDVGSTYNSQMRFGDDVITRVVHATEGGGLKDLEEAVRNDVNDLTSLLCSRHSIRKEQIESIALAGNTIMTHLFWGLNPEYIREEPYIPTANHFPLWGAGAAGIDVLHEAPVYSVPCIASYVGGDIVAGVLASKMHRNSEISLFMDIGTNGEIVIGNNEWLMTAACSAGPCFEGSGIRNGMRATDGAIEKISFDSKTLEPSYDVIGDVRPVGICGSGMIDALGGMFLTGIIDQKGKFVDDDRTDRIRKGPDGIEFLFYKDDIHEVVLTEVDIENILRAKAAIYAGVSLLITEVGLSLDAIEKVYIAGGFGKFLDIEKSIIIGMLPDMPKDKFTFLGNTCIAGTYLALMSEEMRKEIDNIASMMTYIELSVSGRYMDEYMSAMFLPHTDSNLFPSVKELLDNRQA
ncbi:MAG: DUF4445 domain-containing protein [Nitrospirota bacterium]|nr:MAG: DUF4445 domain-containing protein [Nitrospirota bacterium]